MVGYCRRRLLSIVQLPSRYSARALRNASIWCRMARQCSRGPGAARGPILGGVGRKRVRRDAALPARMAEGLEHATDTNLAAVELLGSRYGRHWESLDVDLRVRGLLAVLFGSPAYMDRVRAARAGRATSPPNTATRRNGAKGGRPRRQAG